MSTVVMSKASQLGNREGWLDLFLAVVFEPSAGGTLAVAMTLLALILGAHRLHRLA